LTELGNRLKQAREEKGMSLEDLQTATKIQKRYLIGIEEGNYAIMPGQFYARAFIRQYCEAVGLVPEEIFEEYKNDIPANEADEIPQLSRVKTRKQVPAKNNKVLNFIPKILAFLAFVAVIAIFYVMMQNWDRGNTNDDQKGSSPVIFEPAEPGEEEQANDSENEDENQEEEAPEEEASSAGTLNEVESNRPDSTFELTETEKFEVELSATGETWVSVTNAKQERFLYELMTDGDSDTFDFSAEEEIIFNIGNTTNTEITINGEPFQYPFEDVNQRFTIKFVPNGEQ
jgi:cytoskeletal protein RodZ